MVDLVSGPGNVQPEALPGRPYPRLPDQADPAAYGVNLGKSFEQASQELQNTHDQVQAQARQTMITDAHNKTQALSLKLTVDPDKGAFTKQGQNAFGLDGQYLPQFDQGVQQIAQGIPDAHARQLYLNQVAPQTRAHLSEQLDTHELTQHKAYQQQTLQSGVELASAQAAANFNHPDILAANKDHLNYLLEQMGQTQGWSPDTLQENKEKALSEFHGNVIDSMLAQGQTKQAQTYLFQASAAGEMNAKGAETVQRVISAKQEHDVITADKQQRDASNMILKNGIQASMAGKLTPQWIERYHATLEPQAYEYLYGELQGKNAASTDPHVFAPLLSRAMSGEDVTEDAQHALYGGNLSLADYKNIVEKGESPRKGYVARGTDYINQSLHTNPMVPDPAGQRSLANALDDWRQWADDNPKATETDARKMYQTIADHYQIVAADKTTLFNAVPLHLVGTRMQPDIKGTWEQTKAAHDSGQMSDAEFDRQATLVNQWRHALETQQQKKTPPP